MGTFGVIIDVTPPQTTITSTTPAEAATICTDAATIQFTGADDYTPTNELRYQWQLDGGGWSDLSTDTSQSLAGLGEGPHVFEVAAVDKKDNVDATPATLHFTVDAIPPVVSDVAAVPGTDTCTITCTSDTPVATSVNYGTTVDYGGSSPAEPTASTSHEIALTGLTPGTVYHYRISYSTGCGAPLTTSDATFKTLPDDGHPWVWDAAADFADANPNGAWSYGWTATLGSDWHFYPEVNFPSNAIRWHDSSIESMGAPSLWKNTGTGSQYGVGPGQVSLHPGPANQYSVLRWTAPFAGSYAVNAQFFTGDGGDTDGNVLPMALSIFFADTTNTNPAYSHLLTLSAGDTLDFVVGSKGSFYSDNTPVNVTITTVPDVVPTTAPKLWLRADSVREVADGGAVSTWADSSGNGLDVAQSDTAKQPVYVANGSAGLPVIRFDGGDYLARQNVIGSQLTSTDQASLFVILKQAGAAPRNSVLGWGSQTNRLLLHTTYDDWLCLQHGNGDGAGSVCATQPAGWDDAWHIAEFYCNGAAVSIVVDGVSLPVGAIGDTPEVGETWPLYIGSDRFGNNLTGDVSEILVYDRALPDEERAGVASYLTHRYSLSYAVAPDTQITSAPTEGSTITTAIASFSWTGTDDATPPAQLVFSYRIDGGTWSAFSAGTSQNITNLAPGAHTFEVKARDTSGCEDPSPAVRHFEVDVDSVLFVNVNGGYDGDGNDMYQTLVTAGAHATWCFLSSNGQAAALIQDNTFDQIWVYDLSLGGAGFTADWQAIAAWFNADPSRAIVCDARFISSYWSGRYANEGQKLTQNYYENIKANGGGLMLGTDHSAYQSGINSINSLIGLQPFSGNFSLTMIPVDTTNPLMNSPNDMGSQLNDDSSPGQVPYGLQPNGRIMYSVAWHSGNPDTPGISSTIEGTVGFHINITSPANGANIIEGDPVTLTVEPAGGDGPFEFTWSSDRDGDLGTGASITTGSLSFGQHTITVTGTDSYSRTDTDSITLSIIHESTPPDTQIDSGPAEGGFQAGTSASFTFSGTDDRTPANQLTFSYKMDNGAWSAWSTSTSAQINGIGNGWHDFYVKARDLVGNEDPTPATRHFAVDLSAPAPPSVTDDGDYTNDTTQLHAAWSASDPESGITGYQYAIRRVGDDFLIADWQPAGTNTDVTRTGLSLENGKTYYFAVKATNGVDLTSVEGRSNGIRVDLNAPQISNIATVPSQTQCTITWDTDEPATSQVEYGLGQNYGTVSPLDTALVTRHSVHITGLDDLAGYHFVVKSRDAAGNEAVSDDQTFSTAGLPDLTAYALQAPISTYCGQNVQLRWRVTNSAGGATEKMWADNVYLSQDNQLDAGDIPLISPDLPRPNNLDPNAFYIRTVNVTIPSVPDGDYYFIFAADAGNALPELDETNNTALRGPANIITVVPPVIADIDDQVIAEQVPYTGPTPTLISGTQPVTWSLVTGPAGMTISSATGVVTWPHPVGSTEPIPVMIKASNAANFDVEGWNLTAMPTYRAAVWTDIDVAPCGTPILLYGAATNIASGQPAPNVPVKLRVTVQGTNRYLDATTNAQGQFQAMFYPLATEAGSYTVSAYHPGGSSDGPAQNTFVLVGMTSNPKQTSHDLVPDVEQTGTVTLKNLGDTSLSGITASGVALPGFLTLTVSAPASLDPHGSAPVTYTIKSSPVAETTGTVGIRFTSAEGAVYEMPVSLHVKPPVAHLAVTPSSLAAEVLRGSQTLVEFQVTNTGGAPTDQFDVALPSVPWMTLSTPAQMGPLGPGESGSVVLSLLPDSTQVLGPYTGSVTVAPGKTYGATVPFNFDCVSDKTADVTVNVEDEYTYYAAGNPRVAGATVQLLDPDTAALVREIVTDDTGIAHFTGVTEGYYLVKVEAMQHAPYKETHLIKAGEDNEIKAFMPRETVKYSWTVTPTDIPDTTIITLEATFETHVPTPVVTVEPAVIDLASIPADQDVKQIDLKITNHGLVRAETPTLYFGTHPDWQITPLVSDLGTFLEAQEERIVPVRIERIHGSAQTSDKVAAGGPATNGAPCVIEAHFEWSLVCIGRNYYRVPILVVNASGECGGSGSGSGGSGGWGGGWGGGGGYGGWGSGGGAGGPSAPYTVVPSYTPPNECKPCDPATFEPQEYLGCDLSYLFAPAKAAAEAYILAQTAGWLVPDIKLEAKGSLQSCCASDGSIGLEAKATATAGIDVRLGNTYFTASVDEEVPVEHVWCP